MIERVMGSLWVLTLLFPWLVAAYLAGVVSMGWVSWDRLTTQYEVRLKEADVRIEVVAQAVSLLAKDKFQEHWAKTEAIRQMNRR